MVNSYAWALVVGILISMPVGPVATLCIRQTLAHGMSAGFAAAMGAAIPDALYGALGVVGSRVPVEMFAAHRTAVHVAAGFVLLSYGVYVFRAPLRARAGADDSAPAGTMTLLGGCIASLVLSLPNPGSAVVAAAVFSAAQIAAPTAAAYPAALAAVFAGTLIWWVIVVSVVGRLRRNAAASALLWIDRACAVAMLGAGAFCIATVA